jgi:hypothetical protein
MEFQAECKVLEGKALRRLNNGIALAGHGADRLAEQAMHLQL